MDDPLAGMSGRQRRAHERKAARFFATYDPTTAAGSLAEGLRNGLIIAERVDLDHPARADCPARSDCIDCGANLQHQTPTTAICIACAYRRVTNGGG